MRWQSTHPDATSCSVSICLAPEPSWKSVIFHFMARPTTLSFFSFHPYPVSALSLELGRGVSFPPEGRQSPPTTPHPGPPFTTLSIRAQASNTINVTGATTTIIGMFLHDNSPTDERTRQMKRVALLPRAVRMNKSSLIAPTLSLVRAAREYAE